MTENVQSILNVDDYHPSRYARTKILQQAGFHVVEAATGKQALELAAEHNPMLILLDVNLPDMNGFEVCQLIKKDPRTKATPVLHISASSVQSYHQVHGLNSGADSYLVEPIDPGVLIATVKAFLRAREAEEALRQSNKELEWFAYRVAHDLSEPLRTITAHTELLGMELGGNLDGNAEQCLQFVVGAAQKMRAFIDDLLRYAQVTHSDRQIAEVDSEALLDRIIASLEAAITSTGARITHDPLPPVAADAGLEYVFQNLVGNAIKYRRDGVLPEIHISAREDTDSWLFSVRDNGIGIETPYQKDVFTIFRRLHGGEIPGNGIGLALCQKIIQAQGGAIWVESEFGSGSTFYFTIAKQASPK
jgi:two-component system sensor histidine kinase/response regulator